MDFDEFEKPFGRPSGWDWRLGKGKRVGVSAPPDIHALLKKGEVKKLLSRMAIDPDFKVQVISLLNNNTDLNT